jgi:hypothetical protein
VNKNKLSVTTSSSKTSNLDLLTPRTSIEVKQGVLISVEMAAYLLENKSVNRKINSNRVKSHYIDMLSGRWRENINPICIDVDGRLCDGQHRLEAQIKAGLDLVYIVIYGISKEDMSVLDTGRHRTSANAGQILGYNITNRHTGCIQALSLPTQLNRRRTHSEILELYKIYKESIDFSVDILPKTNSIITSVVCKAHYHFKDTEKLKRLEEFCKVYITESVVTNEESDSGALVLKESMKILKRENISTLSGYRRKIAYLQAQRALKNFIANTKTSALAISAKSKCEDKFSIDIEV